MIEVVNKYKHQATANDIYIGRGSALGNPYTGSKQVSQTKATYQAKDREDAIAKYGEWLDQQIHQQNMDVVEQLNAIWRSVKAGETVYLVCFCKPKACHGDVIRKVIESKL